MTPYLFLETNDSQILTLMEFKLLYFSNGIIIFLCKLFHVYKGTCCLYVLFNILLMHWIHLLYFDIILNLG